MHCLPRWEEAVSRGCFRLRYWAAFSLTSLVWLAGVPPGIAETNFAVLHAFRGGQDGSAPFSTLIEDKAGNLFGTTSGIDSKGMGTIFKLAPDGTETVLHSFRGYPRDGEEPTAGLVMDKDGNLYGTTDWGGKFGLGAVYEYSSKGIARVLYSFQGGADGQQPTSGLLVGRD